MSPLPLPKPRFVVFDLDGTLVDSLLDIAESVNACLELLGLPTRPPEAYRYMVGEGVPALCQRAIGGTHPHLLGRLVELARPLYRTRLLVHTRPYPGVSELVAGLAARGLPLAVLSNKPHDMTARIVEAFWRPGTFAAVQGYVREEHRKPSPRHLLEMCARVGVGPADTWLVGDTPTDVQTAKAAGARCVGVTWGFRTREELRAAGADVIVDGPEVLLAER